MRCAIEMWWSSWVRCRGKAVEGSRYCRDHAWADRFPPFWDGGSVLSGSLLHRTPPEKESTER